MSQRIRIVDATIYAPDPASARELTIEEGRIAFIGPAPETRPSDVTYDAHGCIVTPGLIDALVHGGGGATTMAASVESLRKIARTHARFGTTALCLGTSAAPMDRLCEVVGAIGEVTHHPADRAARVLGAYVEGKLGAPAKRGAHREAYLETPSREVFDRLWRASQGTIRVLSYAPELDANLELTHFLAASREDLNGIVPTMGHTNATYEEARRAIDAGIRRATHTFNGMSGLHRRWPGAVEATLSDPRVHAELIGDGHHVHPIWARFLMRLKSPYGVGLITDALFASALSEDEIEEYFERDPATGVHVTREGRRVYLRDGALYLHPTEDALTGSVITLRDAVRNAITWGASTADALRMATTSPARNLGLERKGELRPGFDADVVVFDSDWNPRAVFVEGGEVFNDLPQVE